MKWCQPWIGVMFSPCPAHQNIRSTGRLQTRGREGYSVILICSGLRRKTRYRTMRHRKYSGGDKADHWFSVAFCSPSPGCLVGSLKTVKVLVEAGADLRIREKICSDIHSDGQSMVNILPSQTTFGGKIADKNYRFAAVSPMRIVTRDDFFSWSHIFFMFVPPRKPGDHTLNSPRKLPPNLTFSL